MKTKKLLGFTLIELLIVIAIIGILAVAFLPTIMGAPAKGRDAARIADVQKLQKVLVNANLEGAAYPDTICIDSAATANVFKVGAADNTSKYLAALGGALPKDPGTADLPADAGGKDCVESQYYYKKAPSSSYSFGVYALVERKESANTVCVDAYGGTLKAVSNETADKWCYVALTQ